MRNFLAAGALLLLCLLAYSPALQAGFNLDDDQLILENPQMQSADGLFRIWTSAEQWDYWPLTYTAYWAQYQAWGENPLPFHALNLLLHALNAWLLYLLLRRLAVPAAWLGAAIFAVHPIMVESVAWIAELKNLLSGLFLLLAVHAYLRYDEEESSRGYAASIVFFLLALLAKTSTVMLPPALLLLLWWKRGEISKQNLVCLLPHFALALAAGLLTIWFASHRGNAHELQLEAGLIERVSIAGKSFWFYLGQFFYPQPCFQYPRWSERPAWIDYLPALAALVLFFAIWKWRHGWGRPTALGLGVYALMLAPVLGFIGAVFFSLSFVADHFAYLPLLGLAPLFAAGLQSAFDRIGAPRGTIPAGIALLALLGFLSWQSTHRFHSKETLFQATLEQNPQSWLSHLGLGLLAASKNELEAAEKHFQESLRTNPRFLRARNNLGSVLHKQKRYEEAEACWLAVLGEDPENATAHFNLGNLRLSQKKPGEAAGHFQAAVAGNPIWAKAHHQLATAFLLMERWGEAEKALRTALRLNPKKAEAHYSLGSVLRAQGKHAEALASFQESAALDSGFAEAWWAVAKSFVALNRNGEALLPATRAMELARGRGDAALADEIQVWIQSSF